MYWLNLHKLVLGCWSLKQEGPNHQPKLPLNHEYCIVEASVTLIEPHFVQVTCLDDTWIVSGWHRKGVPTVAAFEGAVLVLQVWTLFFRVVRFSSLCTNWAYVVQVDILQKRENTLGGHSYRYTDGFDLRWLWHLDWVKNPLVDKCEYI